MRTLSHLLAHLFVSALLLWLVSIIVPGIHFVGFGHAVIAALVLGIINTLVRPALFLVTLPITILTLGLFLIVINALMLELTTLFVPGFTVSNFGSALLGGILLGLFNLAASAALNRSRPR